MKLYKVVVEGMIENILEFLTRGFPKHGDIYRE